MPNPFINPFADKELTKKELQRQKHLAAKKQHAVALAKFVSEMPVPEPVEGEKGDDGKDGRGIVKTQLQSNILEIEYTDGTKFKGKIEVPAPIKGDKGESIKGSPGKNGISIKGSPGKDGKDGTDGLDGRGIKDAGIKDYTITFTYTDNTSQEIELPRPTYTESSGKSVQGAILGVSGVIKSNPRTTPKGIAIGNMIFMASAADYAAIIPDPNTVYLVPA